MFSDVRRPAVQASKPLAVREFTEGRRLAMHHSHAGASPMWESMWGAGLKPGQAFDVGAPSQTLLGELKRMPAVTPGQAALVPGCGRAYDALALARKGFERVVAIDLSTTACAAAQEFLAQSGDERASAVEVVCGDFFAHAGSYDLVWDVTFLCALDPSVRQRWAEQQRRLLQPDGRLLTCVFPIVDKVGGPPFAMSVELVSSLLLPAGFVLVECRDALPEDEQHRPGAMRGPGAPGTALATWQLSSSGSS